VMTQKAKSTIKLCCFFAIYQVRASLFAGILLSLIVLTFMFYPKGASLNRFDLLFILAAATQVILIKFKLESVQEFKVIIVFHILAMVMEIFKTSPQVGSWSYAPGFKIGILGVPLFAGFMYSAVGSYIARAWRIFNLKLSNYPEIWKTVVLAAAIYIHFFAHHYIIDLHWELALITLFIFRKTWVKFSVSSRQYKMPLNLSFLLISFFIWIAENVGTYFKTWSYPGQEVTWHLVRFEKILAWFLLIILSFTLVSLVNKASLSLSRQKDASPKA
jgi:uncharacterized membrane protein YoaT (DUF817 family)